MVELCQEESFSTVFAFSHIQPPSEEPGFAPGEGTFSATPLGWSHAQFVRLAWDIQQGQLTEQPSVVACRYVGCP